MEATKRLFLGIPLDANTQEMIDQFIMLNGHLEVKWVPRENRHVTVMFLGDFPAAGLRDLESGLAQVLKPFRSFHLDPRQFTYAPRPANARMIWLKFHTDQTFDALSRSLFNFLENYYREHDLPLNLKLRRKNIPHSTLARFKPPAGQDLENLNQDRGMDNMPSLPVDKIGMYESHLQAHGARYEILSSFELSTG